MGCKLELSVGFEKRPLRGTRGGAKQLLSLRRVFMDYTPKSKGIEALRERMAAQMKGLTERLGAVWDSVAPQRLGALQRIRGSNGFVPLGNARSLVGKTI